MKINYKSVSYFGQKQDCLHFIDLSIDNENYGNVIMSINTELGAKLNKYCLNKEQAIEVESTGEDIDLIQIDDNEIKD